ncbi:fimbria/pilus periplasmic chaperone [Escherichia coli]|nr:fimbria/pilus periplasmic chaperone [Escherichia coli]
MQTTRTPYSISFMATVLLLLLFACHSTVANAAVALGATRVIYPANQKQVLLPVTNNDPASVYLIQSWIENAGDQKDTQFVITPPLFSMQGKKENTLRIINATNHQLPVSVDITHAATGDISFQTINDYGALTPRIKATMQ